MAKDALSVTAPLIKSIVFAVFGSLVLGLLFLQFGGVRFTPETSYSAIFTSASGILEAAPVTASGLVVGKVDNIEVIDNSLSKIDFTIESKVKMTEGTIARIRYKNLTGDQFIDLSPGDPNRPALPEDGVIPVSQTTPALDLDVLLGGFDPLFQGLQPEQVNQLASNLVSVFQGQGGTVNDVLRQAASFSGSLADQDKVIGSVITNFNTVLGNLDTHSADLSETIKAAQGVISALSKDRVQLVNGLERTSQLAGRVGDIAAALRTGHDTFRELGRAAGLFNANGEELDRVLGLLPGAYLRLGRLSVEGAAYQVSGCSVKPRVTGADGKPFYPPQIGPSDNSPRCSYDNIAPLQGGRVDVGARGPELPPMPPSLAVSAPQENGDFYDAAKPNEDHVIEPHKYNPQTPQTPQTSGGR